MASGKSLIKSQGSDARRFIVSRTPKQDPNDKTKGTITTNLHDNDYKLRRDGSIIRNPDRN